MAFNTGNPVGSIDPRDLIDNAPNLDLAVNSSDASWTDRLGQERPTLKRLEADYPLAGAYAEQASLSQVAAEQAKASAEQSATDAAGKVTEAEAAKDLAVLEATRAEAARDAAFVNADLYETVAEGIAGTAEGGQFQVLSADGLEYVRHQHEAGGVAAELAGRYPTAQLTKELRSAIVSGISQSSYKLNLVPPELSSCSAPVTLGFGANTWASDIRVYRGIKVFSFTALEANYNTISYIFRAPATEFEQVASFSQVVEKSDVVISAPNSAFILRGIDAGGGNIPGASITLNLSESGFTTRLVTDSTYIGLDGVDISALMAGATYIEITVRLNVRDAVAGSEIMIHSPCFVGDVAAQFRPSYPEYISTEGETW